MNLVVPNRRHIFILFENWILKCIYFSFAEYFCTITRSINQNESYHGGFAHALVHFKFCVFNFYRPQRSCGKVIFSQASVILFTGGGCLPSACWDTHPPSPRKHTHTHREAHSTPPGKHTPHPLGGHCSGRYASYWNAFLSNRYFGPSKNFQI